jgi:hypothetical protein
VSDVDPHSPTAAGPAPESWQAPAGSGLLDGGQAGAPAAEDRPELLVGAAFAGGVVAAMIFKRLLGGRG